MRLDLAVEDGVAGRDALHWRRDVVAFWCPSQLAAGSPVFRVGWFQRYQMADEPLPVEEEGASMLRRLRLPSPTTAGRD